MTLASDAARIMRAQRRSYDLTCQVCGAAFRATDSHGLYCSPRCKQRALRARKKVRKVEKEE